MALKWNDQPAVLATADVVFDAFSMGKHGSAQLLTLGGFYYLTVGNLFGSSTVKSESLAALGKVIYDITYHHSKPVDLKRHPEVELVRGEA